MKFTQSSRRHRIGRAHARFVLETTERVFSVDGDGHVFVWWFGADDRGVELEIMGRYVLDERTGQRALLIMHVMPSDFRK